VVKFPSNCGLVAWIVAANAQDRDAISVDPGMMPIDRGNKTGLSGRLFLCLLLEDGSGKLQDLRRCIFSVLAGCRFEDQFSCGDF